MQGDYNKEDDKILRFLKEYWFLLVFFAAVVIAWANLQSQVTTNTNSIALIQQKQEADSALIIDIQTRLTKIETTLEFIKNQVTR